MKILDCTLRDGANVVGNGFDAGITESVVKGLIRCGIKDIELGNAKGMGAHDAGATAPLDDKGYMELVRPYTKDGALGMFVLAKNSTKERAELAKEYGLTFLRVGANASDGASSVDAVKAVKDAGLYCRYSLMKAYVSTPKELAEEAKLLESAGVDLLTIMDSAGTMYPEEATEYVKTLKAAVKIPIGFHGHSNLGLSQANAICAARAGAEEIDGGLLGMARSAGNCATEIAVATLQKEGYLKDIDLYALLDYLDKELIPLMKPHDYHVAVDPTELVLGLSGCHSNYMGMFKKVAEEKHVDLRQLIVEVSKINRKDPDEALLEDVAKKIA